MTLTGPPGGRRFPCGLRVSRRLSFCPEAGPERPLDGGLALPTRGWTVEEREIFALLEPHVGSQGLDLVEVALSGGRRRAVVRLVVHSEGGVTHGDCARITRVAGSVLDEACAFPGSYVLEVWSPGTDRVLRSPREFDLFRGRLVQVTWADGDGGATGRAAGTRGEESVALTREDGGEDVLPWSRIARARLVPEPPERGTARG